LDLGYFEIVGRISTTSAINSPDGPVMRLQRPKKVLGVSRILEDNEEDEEEFVIEDGNVTVNR